MLRISSPHWPVVCTRATLAVRAEVGSQQRGAGYFYSSADRFWQNPKNCCREIEWTTHCPPSPSIKLLVSQTLAVFTPPCTGYRVLFCQLGGKCFFGCPQLCTCPVISLALGPAYSSFSSLSPVLGLGDLSVCLMEKEVGAKGPTGSVCLAYSSGTGLDHPGWFRGGQPWPCICSVSSKPLWRHGVCL